MFSSEMRKKAALDSIAQHHHHHHVHLQKHASVINSLLPAVVLAQVDAARASCSVSDTAVAK
jgi:hypothetical protein